MSSYSIEDLVRDVTDAVAQGGDPKVVCESVGEAMRRYLAGPFLLGGELGKPVRGTLTSMPLHRDPNGKFAIVLCAWAPQHSTPIHDHSSWGVIAGVVNRVIVTHYRRLDEGDIPGFADVAEMSRVLVSETSFAQLRQGEEPIHKIENPFKDPAVTLHVFGEVEPWRNMYDPPAKTVTPYDPAENTIAI